MLATREDHQFLQQFASRQRSNSGRSRKTIQEEWAGSVTPAQCFRDAMKEVPVVKAIYQKAASCPSAKFANTR